MPYEVEQVAETGTITVTIEFEYTAGMIGKPSWAEQGVAKANPEEAMVTASTATRNGNVSLTAFNKVRFNLIPDAIRHVTGYEEIERIIYLRTQA